LEKPEEQRAELLHLFESALSSVAGDNLILERVKREGKHLQIDPLVLDLSRYSRIMVAGAGKCVAEMAHTLEEIIPEFIDSGIIVVKEGHLLPLRRIELVEGGHPYPDKRGLAATRRLLSLANGLGKNDLLLFLLSGGASALLVLPAEGISLEDKITLTHLLFRCGARIREVNGVRKHLSSIKGGNLAKAAYPASVVSLILSDVIGNRFEDIGSGPTAPDNTTYHYAFSVLEDYGLWNKVPLAVRRRIEQGMSGTLYETPKPGEAFFSRVNNILLADNLRALSDIQEKGQRKGYNTLILTSSLQGEAREVAKVFSAVVREIKETGKPIPPPALVIAGGETTVRVKGSGKGGRNCELALSFLVDMDGLNGVTFLSGGSDGSDGPTDAAGAVVDRLVTEKMKEKGIAPRRYLEENDSYNFFKETGGLLVTDPTRTNVMDIQLLLVKEG
jgi:glycerate 2-kinase